MIVKTTYKGYKNGVYGIYCGFKPKGLKVVEEIPVYYPDSGKVFIKNETTFSVVILEVNEEISEYEEVSISDNN